MKINKPTGPTKGPQTDGPRINEAIQSHKIRLIDEKGDMVGVVNVREALQMAQEVGLDLVEISPHVDPPVCKILDFGKFRFENQKKKAAERKRQKVVEIKEIKMRPMIEDNDYQTKMRSIKRFIEEENKVKVTMRFRGRELAHQDIGMEVLKRVIADMEDLIKIELHPKFEGKQIIMILGPKG